MVDDELSGESQKVLVHGLEQGRDQDDCQVVSRHLVHLREHLDPAERQLELQGLYLKQVCV